MLHIVIDFLAVCLFNNVVNYGTEFRVTDSVNQVSVATHDIKVAQCGFDCVIVKRDFIIFQEYAQVLLLVYGISKRFLGLEFRRNFMLVRLYLCKIASTKGAIPTASCATVLRAPALPVPCQVYRLP